MSRLGRHVQVLARQNVNQALNRASGKKIFRLCMGYFAGCSNVEYSKQGNNSIASRCRQPNPT